LTVADHELTPEEGFQLLRELFGAEDDPAPKRRCRSPWIREWRPNFPLCWRRSPAWPWWSWIDCRSDNRGRIWRGHRAPETGRTIPDVIQVAAALL